MATNLTILSADFTNNSAISIRPIIFNHITFKKIYRDAGSTPGYIYIPETELNIPIGANVGFINSPQFKDYPQSTTSYGFVLGEFYEPNDCGGEWIYINSSIVYNTDIVQTPKVAHTVYINTFTTTFIDENNLTNHLLNDFGWWL